MKKQLKIGEKREFSLQITETGIKESVFCELKDDFHPYFFICKNCEYGGKGETIFWFTFSCCLPENCNIIVCPNCEKIIYIDWL